MRFFCFTQLKWAREEKCLDNFCAQIKYKANVKTKSDDSCGCYYGSLQGRCQSNLIRTHQRSPDKAEYERCLVCLAMIFKDLVLYLFPFICSHKRPRCTFRVHNLQPVTGRRCTSGDPPPAQPPRVPARASLPLPKRDIAAAQNPLGGGVPFAKNQEAKASVASNLKNLKKRLLKKKSLSQDYAKETERGGTAGNEYQSITELRTSDSQTSQSCTNVELTKGELPYEYLPPPPFAPGF